MARHFLLVEKSDIMLKILHETIMTNIDDAVISEIHNNDEVISHIEQNPCHLILSCWDVADHAGPILINQLEQHDKGKSIPYIILLGNEPHYEKEAVAAGVQEYLKMPCAPRLLTNTINRVCNPVSLRGNKRYSPTDATVHIEQRTDVVKAEVVNISVGGLLCDLKYNGSFNFAEPMMMSIEGLVQGADEAVKNLYSVMTNLKVIERNSDFTPKWMRVGVAFVNTPDEKKHRLEYLLKKAELKDETVS